MKNVMPAFLIGMFLFGTTASASGEETVKPKLTVVLDVEKVFSNYKQLDNRLAELLDEAEQYAASVAKKRKCLAAKRNELKTYKVGTAEYMELGRKLARDKGALNGEAKFQRGVFRQREAQLYLRAYSEIQKEVESFAADYDITLVENFSTRSIEEDDVEDFELAIKNPVVFHKNLDITSAIIEAVNKKEGLPTEKSINYNRPIEELRATGLRFPFYPRQEIWDSNLNELPGYGSGILWNR